jgi:hypothetical protein
MKRVALAASFAALALALVAFAACDDLPPPPTCQDIPAGGCPSAHGAACNDPTCEASYLCTESGWVLERACPPRDAAPDRTTPPDASDAARDVASFDVAIDAPDGAFGGPGCNPLEAPDCSLGLALQCASAGNCCGCEDLFVCENGGWDLWGSCAGGNVTPR